MAAARVSGTTAVLAVALLVLPGITQGSATTSPSDRRTLDPIIGTWETGSGLVAVTGSGHLFQGTLVFATTRQKTRPNERQCPRPVGDVIWRIHGKKGNSYVGSADFELPPCRPGSSPLRYTAFWTVVRPASGRVGHRGLMRMCGPAVEATTVPRRWCIDIRGVRVTA